ncbi:MAG: TonB-dependent receptor [Gammaproteobacteria bacterium]|nr:TonB-dependent receptor [Gammaproteobacteria bacterium]
MRSDLGDRWAATLSGVYQQSDISGSWDYEPDLGGDREVTRFLPEQSDLSYGQVALTLEGDAGIGDLVYAGAYYRRNSDTVSDYSSYVAYVPWAGWTQQFACNDFYWYGNVGCNDPSMYFDLEWNVDRWSHEVRLTSPGDGPLNWIVGAFFEETESRQIAFWGMEGIQHGGVPSAYYLGTNGGVPLPEEWYFADAVYNWGQQAAFGEVAYRFTDELTATFGMRAFRSNYDKEPSPDFNIFYDPKAGGTGVEASTNDVIYKANLTWEVNDDLLTYFNFAQGFRPGGANTTAEDDQIPETYGPDVLDSFEVGWKSTLNEGRVTFNGAVYLMKWKDFQTNIYDPDVGVVNFIANVGDAETRGFEIDLNAYLTENLAVQVAATHNNGELTDRFQASESAFAEAGQRLPLVSEWKTFVNVRYHWQQGSGTAGYAQATYSYTGDSWNQLVTAGYVEFAPQLQAPYDTMDVRVGWVLQEGRYGVELFATNVFDEQAQIFINTAQADRRITTIRPRTFGVRLRTRFD